MQHEFLTSGAFLHEFYTSGAFLHEFYTSEELFHIAKFLIVFIFWRSVKTPQAGEKIMLLTFIGLTLAQSNLNLKSIILHISGIYASRFAAGNAEWNKRWTDFKVTANIHDDFAMDLYNHLQVAAR